MPQDRAGEEGRVDNWDEEDAAPARAVPVSRRRAVASPGDRVQTPPAADPPAAEPQATIRWREVIRRTPLWIWLIGLVAAGGICMMFMTVMLIIGFAR